MSERTEVRGVVIVWFGLLLLEVTAGAALRVTVIVDVAVRATVEVTVELTVIVELIVTVNVAVIEVAVIAEVTATA
jgi:hypothetical protein